MRLAAMGAVAAGLIGFFIFITTQLSSANMSLLYSDLELGDSSQIAAQLDTLGVPFELRADGAAIMVPADQVDRLRLVMAQEGLPKGGSLGYEIFDRSDGFGTTNFMQNINRLRALEGELARTIMTIDRVRQARVHLVMPERQLFSRERDEPTASVFLRVGGGELGSVQIAAIQHLVASAVPRLQPQNISIVDDRGNLLAKGPGGDADDLRLATAEEMRRNYEERLTRTIEDLLAQTIGPGRVRAEVSADMDFDRITTSSETFDPNSQVARSTQLVEESTEANEGDGFDPVTVAENLPEPGGLDVGGGATATNRSNRLEETVNFEISKTVQSSVREVGSVKRLSVAVLVDGTYATDAEGVTTYEPRPQEALDRIATLVRSAVGFDEARGDVLEVITMPFVPVDDPFLDDETGGPFGIGKGELLRLAEIAVLGIVAILVLLLVVRPVLGRILDSGVREDEGSDLLAGPNGLQLAGPGNMASVPGLPGPAGLPTEGGPTAEEEIDALIDVNQVDGRVRASALRKVGDIIEKHPEEAANIIRNWMFQET